MRLEQCLLEIPDPRRKEGMRHNLPQMFSMLILSGLCGLCGYFGGRPTAKFSQANKAVLTKQLNLKHPPPSHSSAACFMI